MKIYTINGVPMKLNNSLLGEQDFHEIVSWTHSWDVHNAVTYDDGGTTRVDYIKDLSGDKPLIRDQGNYGPAYSQPICEGPLLISSSPRFRGRPCFVCDDATGTGNSGSFSLLTTTEDWLDASGHFNAPNGISQPYWVCALARLSTAPGGIWDAADGSAGTTISLFTGFIQNTFWGATTGVRGGGDPGGPDLWPNTPTLQSVDQTVCVIAYVNGASSWFEVTYKASNGALNIERDTSFALNANAPAKEIFFGWHGVGAYVSAAGIKSGVVSETDVTNARTWCARYMPAAATLASEP